MGAAASEPAGLLPPWPGPGRGGAACVLPPRAEEIPATRGGPVELSVSGAMGNGGGGLGGGLGGPALRFTGAGGAAGGAACALPDVLLLVPSVVGEVVPGARGAVWERAELVGVGGGAPCPQHAAAPQQGSAAGHTSPLAAPGAAVSRHAGSQLDGASIATFFLLFPRYLGYAPLRLTPRRAEPSPCSAVGPSRACPVAATSPRAPSTTRSEKGTWP